MTSYSYVLLLFILSVLWVDFAVFGRANRRVFLLEIIIFSCGGVFVAFPDFAQRLAERFGVGRGVDFVVYPVLIWLVRESIVSRYLRWDSEKRLAVLVRRLSLEKPVQAASVVER